MKTIKSVPLMLIAVLLSGCFASNPFVNTAYQQPNTTWVSSDPYIWYHCTTGQTTGEMTWNGDVIKIVIGVVSNTMFYISKTQADKDAGFDLISGSILLPPSPNARQ